MRTATLTLLSLLSLAACAKAAEDNASSDESNQTQGFALYPDVRDGMVRLGELTPQNTSVADFGTDVRNQGTIASCASFGFLGLLENQLFNDRGIRVDLSERFMIFSNYFQTGTLGGSRETITKFPSLVKNVGLLTDDLYPYAPILPNANRFGQDAAQGLSDDAANAPTPLTSVIEPTAASSKERSEIIQRSEFLGKLPQGEHPIMLPAKADLLPNNRNPEFQYQAKIYRCFAAGGPESVPVEKRIAVSPREYLAMCFDHDPAAYYTCSFDMEKTVNEAGTTIQTQDQCEGVKQLTKNVGVSILEQNRKALKITLALLDKGQASFVAVKAPAQGGSNAVWSSVFPQGSGHAVLATGYVTFDELSSGEEQERGLLQSGIFDKYAAAVEPAYAEKLAAGLPTDKIALRDVRVASRLGQRMKTEGGLITFRNSWGRSTGGPNGSEIRIGLDGNQGMTFDFFLKNLMVTQSRANKRVNGVAWQSAGGPGYCPAEANVSQGGSWLDGEGAQTSIAEYAKGLLAPLVPPNCH